MKIGVIHEISDVEAFEEQGTALLEDTPEGFMGHQFCPSTDGTVATCVWEADSASELSEFIDTQLEGASEQQYFEIEEEVGFGIPD